MQCLCEQKLVCAASTFLVDKEANLSAESRRDIGNWGTDLKV